MGLTTERELPGKQLAYAFHNASKHNAKSRTNGRALRSIVVLEVCFSGVTEPQVSRDFMLGKQSC